MSTTLIAALVLGLPVALGFALFFDGARHALAARWLAASHRDRRYRVIGRTELSADTFTLNLRPPLLAPLRYRAGQHLVLSVPLAGGRSVRRAYSISRWSPWPWTVEISIKREAGGKGSPQLHDTARPGTSIIASPPKGHFGDPDITAPVVLIAAGIGITPLRAMLHRRTLARRPGRVVLHFTSRTPEGLYFHDEFTARAARHHWFDYQPRLTSPTPDWTGETGRLDVPHLLANAPENAHFVICAGKTMERAIIDGLRAAGIAENRIHREQFAAAAEEAELDLAITCNGTSFRPGRATSLLDALDRQGLAPPYECRTGECGACRVRLLDGNVKSTETGKPVPDTSILACCVMPTSDVTVAF
jgi:ferredoxin-NADP reductase